MKGLKSALLVLCLFPFLFSCGRVFESVSVEAVNGQEKSFDYQDLAKHEALEVSFTAHLVGPWDGSSGGTDWSPDRFFFKLGDMTLIDSTFNNCHLIFRSNTWQSFPDPYHKRQIDLNDTGAVDNTYLYLGGRGASAVASLGFKWVTSYGEVPSMDCSYSFRFVVPHNKDSVRLLFGTKWNEEKNSVATYHLENVRIKLLNKITTLDSSAEEEAWLSFFSGSPEASQQAWENIYATHPDKLTERVDLLLGGDRERRDYLVEQLKKGDVPIEALYQEVDLNPNAKDLKEQMHRVLCLRELAMGPEFFSREEEKEMWAAPRGLPGNRALAEVCSLQRGYVAGGCIPLQKAQMRIASYLRMANTEKSLKLAEQLDPVGGK